MMHDYIVLNTADGTLQIGMVELIGFLVAKNAKYVKIGYTTIRVEGPKSLVNELHERSNYLSYPFTDLSH